MVQAATGQQVAQVQQGRRVGQRQLVELDVVVVAVDDGLPVGRRHVLRQRALL